jgi:hypothetical protein
MFFNLLSSISISGQRGYLRIWVREWMIHKAIICILQIDNQTIGDIQQLYEFIAI